MKYFGATFRRFGKHWKTLLTYWAVTVAVTFVLSGVTLLASAQSASEAITATDPLELSGGAGFSVIAVSIFGMAFLFYVGIGVVKVILGDEGPSEMFSVSLSVVLNVFWYIVFLVFIVGAVGAALFLPLLASPLLAFISVPLSIVFFAWFYPRIATVIPRIVSGETVLSAVQHSWEETKPVFWSILGNGLLLGVLIYGVSFAFGLAYLFGSLLSFLGGGAGFLIFELLSNVVEGLVQACISVLLGCFAVTVYEERVESIGATEA